jgi:hypothetical protein
MALPSPCPVCGAYSLPPGERYTVLLAVCDVLCLKALEQLGKYLVRAERSRFNVLCDRPFSEAHTIWRAPDSLVDKALRNTWDVVPLLIASHGPDAIDPGQVVRVLDDYIHDLAVAGYPHSIQQLAYRFVTRLSLPVQEAAWA